MLRRPFSYVGGVDENSQLDQGLLFTCYQRSLADGFMTVQDAPRRRGARGVHPPARRRVLHRAAGSGTGDDGYLGQSLLEG